MIPQVLNLLFNEPAKIVIHLKEERRAGGTIAFFNYFGTPLYEGEAHALLVYEAIGVTEPWMGCKYAAFVRTDEHMNHMKDTHKWCACCIGKVYSLRLKAENLTKFRGDSGLDKEPLAKNDEDA